MIEIHKQSQAEQDLINIWRYSFEQWGEEQADFYLDTLAEGIALLVDNPQIGTDCSFIRPDYRRLIIQHHIVYYQLSEKRIDIIRVLHKDMDMDHHL